MRGSIGSVLLLVGLLGAQGVPAHGQGRLSMNAAIPFKFVAGDSEFPSGNCSFAMDAQASRLSIRASRASTVVQGTTLKFMGDVFKDAPKSEMLFNRYGDEYFLAQVWIKNHGMELARSARELELEKGGAEAKVVKLKLKSN